jgi:hypothetical protein
VLSGAGSWLLALALAIPMAVGAALAWRATGPVERPFDPATPGRMFVLLFLLTTGIGTLIITASGEATGAGAAVAGGGLLVFGVAATAGAGRWGRGERIGPTTEPSPFRPVALVGLVGVGVAGYLAIAAGNGIPFLTSDAQATRLAYGGIAFDLFRWLVPPAALAVLATALAQPGRGRWVAAGLALGVVGGVLFLTASRALPLELALAALLLVWWAGRRLPGRVWIVLGLLTMVFFIGVQLLRVGPHGGFRDIFDVGQFAAGRTMERLALIQARTLELIAVQIPSQQPFYLGGTYIRWLAPLHGSAPAPALGTWLFAQVLPGSSGGFVTPGFIGELWANGGIVATVAGMAAFGLVVGWLGRLLGRFDAGAADRVLAALLVIAIGRTYATSLNGVLLTIGVAVAWRLLVAPPTPPAWLPVPDVVLRRLPARAERPKPPASS